MTPTFFSNQQEFRAWLEKNHAKESQLLVGFYKVGTGKTSMSWSQSVDQALCFGWIDGVRKSIDAEAYSIRFTPRKSNSIWSNVNIKKVEELTKAGLMQSAGLEAFRLRKESKSGIYAHEKEAVELSSEYQNTFTANAAAWDFFNAQAPSYQKSIVHWIMSAKRAETRLDRLRKTIEKSEQHQRVSLFEKNNN